MNVLQRFVTSLRNQGLAATLIKTIGPFFDRRFDAQYGIDTCGVSRLDEFTIESENRDHGARYEASRVLPLRRMMSEIPKLMPDKPVLMDLGSGKGRVLFVGAEAGFKDLRGVEFAAELCDIAERNWKIFKARTSSPATCEIIRGDVTQYGIRPDENVFFMFNPFDEVILVKVLNNLLHSLAAHPREILVVVCLPSQQYQVAFEQSGVFRRTHRFNFWGCDFSVYSNRGH